MLVISLSGLIGAGKDSIADYLVDRHDFQKESWAGSLKDAVSAVFGWDRTLLEGKTQESRLWREEPDQWWSNRLGYKVTPRAILQEWGTDLCRKHFHDEVWVASLENRLKKSTKNVVISDSRFPNEIDAVRRIGGLIVRVKRGPDPEWVNCYKKDKLEFKWKYGNNIHPSEYSSVDCDYDYVIDNDSSINELYSKVSSLLQCHQAAKLYYAV